MNQMWVRISLTYVVLVIFLFLIPTVVYLTINADEINLGYSESEEITEHNPTGVGPTNLFNRLVNYPRIDLVKSLLRILFSISMIGILVGVISSRGLAAPLNNLAEAAKAVGSQVLKSKEVKRSGKLPLPLMLWLRPWKRRTGLEVICWLTSPMN